MNLNHSNIMNDMKHNKTMAKELPYGIQDFVTIAEQNIYFVDKTMYIPELESQARYLFFIRPRRFGKSLLLSMLHAYYDIRTKDKFHEWFDGLWIGSHPTPLQGRYQILHLDFSQVGGTIEELEKNFDRYCGIMLNEFMDIYSEHYPEETRKAFYASDDAGAKLTILCRKAHTLGYPLYLIIDEYDNFTNTVLNEQGEKVYWAITHAEGFYRDIFKKFKGNFERIFITGVSPVTLDDVTSGFNIGWHISTKAEFNQMLGFSEEEVREMFAYYQSQGMIPAEKNIDDIIKDMKPWYDNYCFSKRALDTQSRVFNSDMVIYYLRNMVQAGEPPKQMLDPNTKTDNNTMKRLLQLDRLDGDRKGVIVTVAEKGEILGNIEETFPARALTDPNIFVSLLFYYGMLTIKGTFGDMEILGIPNNNVRKQYYNYLLEQYQEEKNLNIANLKTLFAYMAIEGKWEDCLGFMAKAYADVSAVRDGIEAERNLQGFFMAYLNLNNYYYTAPELELSHGYCDFFLLPDLTHYKTSHSYILELKVLPKSEYNAPAKDGKTTKAELQWQEAVEQIQRYAEAPRVEALRQGTKLHKIIMQFEGWQLKRMEEV